MRSYISMKEFKLIIINDYTEKCLELFLEKKTLEKKILDPRKKSSGSKKISSSTRRYFFCLSCVLILSCIGTQDHSEPGIYYIWQKGDDLEQLSKLYQVSVLTIRKRNDIYEPEDLVAGKRIFIPTRIPSQPISKILSKPKKTSKLDWPAKGTISSGFGKRQGKMHYGIDITRDGGPNIVSVTKGVVTFSGRKKGFGNTIIIDHGNSLKTLYAHNSKLFVKKGAKVKRGQLISNMGSTGKVTGIHLHFEVHHKGKAKNPLRYLTTR